MKKTIFFLAAAAVTIPPIYMVNDQIQSNQLLLNNILDNMANVQTLHYDGELTVYPKILERMYVQRKNKEGISSQNNNYTKINFSTDEDLTDPNNKKSKAQVVIESYKSGALNTGKGMHLFLQTISLNNSMYLNAQTQGMQIPANNPEMDFLLGILSNQWIKIDPRDINGQLNLQNSNINQQLMDSLSRNQVLRLNHVQQGNGKLNGEISINKMGLLNFIEDANKIINNQNPNFGMPNFGMKEKMLLGTKLMSTPLPTFLFTVDQNTLLPEKISSTLLNDNNEIAGQLSIVFSNYNQPVGNIIAPTQFKTLPQIYSELNYLFNEQHSSTNSNEFKLEHNASIKS